MKEIRNEQAAMKRQWWTIAVFFLLVVSFPIYGYIQNKALYDDNPESVQGVLDLTQWDFERDGTIPLVGEWEFYRSQLLEPADFEQRSMTEDQRAIVDVPGRWNSYIAEHGKPESTGYGTYRLQIDASDYKKGTYGIRAPNIRLAHTLWVNGQEVSGGKPGATAEQTRSYNAPEEHYFNWGGSHLEIVVQVSNFDYESGGIIYPLLLGNEQQIKRAGNYALSGDMINTTAFAIFFVFFILLYFMRREERSLLFLSLFCLSVMIYVLTHGEKLMLKMQPDMSYELFMRVQSLSSTSGYYFLLHYVHVSVPNTIKTTAWRISNAIAAAAFIFAVFLSSLNYSKWFPLALTASVYIFGVLLYTLIIGVLRGSRDAVFLISSAICIFVYMIVSTMHVLGQLENTFLISFELLIFVVVQVLMLAKRFSRSFHEVEELSSKLKTLDGLKDEFMANTSHELRTPLHGIVNIAESLLQGVAGSTNADQTRQLDMIVTTGRRLNYLIDDILDFSKLRGGELKLNRRVVDLPSAAQSVLEIIEQLSSKKGLRLTRVWPLGLPPLDTDEDRLRQILFNLLGNAVKFTHNGEIGITAEALPGMVKISIRDSGIGISPDRLGDIFKPFNQVAAEDNNRSYTGTGIGLTITKKLIELNGGSIGVSSEPGVGSVFYFTLPIASEQAIAAEQVAASRQILALPPSEQRGADNVAPKARAGLNSLTVLAVDDDPVNLQVLINLLSMENYTVIAVRSGAEALKALSGARRIDLVITDWMMPEMSGIELCRHIRERYSLSELPVLMLTARSLAGDVETGFTAGVNDFLTKPVDGGVLRARVRTLLELRQLVKTAIRSELAFLQAQIKPHFLYNALNTIISICPTDADKATELLMELSSYLRSSFDFQSREQVVTLDKELELVRSYVALEQARFGNRLQVVYDVDTKLKGLIPPLCIQPIVENAVRHGVTQKTMGGCVTLQVRQEGEYLQIKVSDDGVGMRLGAQGLLGQAIGKRQGVGLRNIHQRLLSLYGKGLMIESKIGEGTTVIFEVPQ